MQDKRKHFSWKCTFTQKPLFNCTLGNCTTLTHSCPGQTHHHSWRSGFIHSIHSEDGLSYKVLQVFGCYLDCLCFSTHNFIGWFSQYLSETRICFCRKSWECWSKEVTVTHNFLLPFLLVSADSSPHSLCSTAWWEQSRHPMWFWLCFHPSHIELALEGPSTSERDHSAHSFVSICGKKKILVVPIYLTSICH